MKVRSLQFRFLVTIMSAILSIAIFIGGFSIYEVNKYIKEQTESLVKSTCSNEVSQINDILGDIEKSVTIMESYVLSLYKTKEDALDPDKHKEVTALAEAMFGDIAKNTDGAIAYYLRYNPDVSGPTSGLFYSQTTEVNEYVRFDPTDLSLYEKNDVEHVGWFWIPHEARRPVWISPYYNRNNDILMISYSVPLYFENQFIGIVGMDFDYSVLEERVRNIKIYENGFAQLEQNGVVITPQGDENGGEPQDFRHDDYMMITDKLDNGMTFVLYASYDDIRQIELDITYNILITVIFLLLVFSLIVFFMVKTITRPLKKLTAASEKLAKGDYNVEILHSKTYEIDKLSSAFENMIDGLKEHRTLQNFLTYRDPLTKLRNTTAYRALELAINKRIKEEDFSSFGVMMCDLNCLKETNDTYGHIVGDRLIAASAHVISDTFKRSPVFRIGGDEFLVILRGRDLEDYDDLMEEFKDKCANTFVDTEDSEKIQISIATGISVFNPDTDTLVSDVFKRADSNMYSNKRRSKSER